MLDKLIQAAILTFLLHLIAGLSASNTVHINTARSLDTLPTSITSSLLSFLR